MVKIYLFRTGHITNKDIFCGWLNLPLSKKGISQSKEVAKKLKPIKIGYAFCSDQLRGKQALIEVLKFHKKTKVIIDHRLRERHYGVFSGHEKKVFQDLFPEKFKEIHRHKEANIPKGENMDDVSKRVFPFMNELIKFIQDKKENIVVCAHTNSLRLIRSYLEEQYNLELLESYPTDVFEYEVHFE